MSTFSRLLCACIGFSAALGGVPSIGQDTDQEPGLARATITRLESLELTAEQRSSIEALASEYEASIDEAAARGRITSAQRQARTEAIQRAIAEGLKGRAFNEAVAQTSRLTPEQREAREAGSRLRSEFDSRVMNLLTSQQQDRLSEAADDLPRQRYSGFIIVRLSPEIRIASAQSETLADATRELDLNNLSRMLEELQLTRTRRLVQSLSVERLLEIERTAKKSMLPPRYSLASYWRIDARDRENPDQIVNRLNALPEVDLAYQEFVVTEPAVMPGDDVHNADQDYHDAAGTGIDARWVWTQANGQGAGVGFVDVEQGWFPDHEDFACKRPTLIYGDNRDGIGGYQGNHGTAVLGEVIADDNAVGVVGIAPTVDYVSMTSHYDAATNTAPHVADAILGALPAMNPGDVLLLEVQRNRLPTEVDDADFDAIRLAVASEMIVVEAAGNGSTDLDDYVHVADGNIFDRSDADFRESGAIMVGAAHSPLPHNRKASSNFGSRIDCYAWGENVVTCGYGDRDAGGGDKNKTYTSNFRNTSAASAIIAGAAILVQGVYRGGFGSVLSPPQMRALLSDPANGTPQGGGVPGHVGVMPNLRLIIEGLPDR